MKKYLLSGAMLLLAASTFSASAQAFISAADRLRLNLVEKSLQSNKPVTRSASATEERTSLIIKLAAGYSERDVESDEVGVINRINDVLIANATDRGLLSLSNNPAVATLQLSAPANYDNARSQKAGNADKVAEGYAPLKQPYTGKGVIIGMIDQGIQFNHINFRDKEGKSRIKKVWLYTPGGGEPTELNTPEEIAARKDDSYIAYNQYTLKNDTITASHGTHTTGSAAGSYFGAARDSITKEIRTGFSGVAPEADIILACGAVGSADTYFIDAVAKMRDYAKEVGKRLVINTSMGNNRGPHDGTDLITSESNKLAEMIPWVVSAGNEAGSQQQLVKTFTATDRTLSCSADNENNGSLGFFVDIYSKDSTNPKLKLSFLEKETGENVLRYKNGELSFDGDPLEIDLGQIKVGEVYKKEFPAYIQSTGKVIKDPVNYPAIISVTAAVGSTQEFNRYNLSLTVKIKQDSHELRVNPYIFTEEGTPGNTIYLYTNGVPEIDYKKWAQGGQFSEISGKKMDRATANGSINSLPVAKNIISVGNYNPEPSCKLDQYGLPHDVDGYMHRTSSWGITCDDRSLPNLAAPGTYVYSSLNSNYKWHVEGVGLDQDDLHTATVDGENFMFGRYTGTSMSAPYVTGTVALMLEANPNLKRERIQEILMKSARKTLSFDLDSVARPFQEPLRQAAWGAGLVDTFEAVVDAARDAASSSNVKIDKPVTMARAIAENVYQLFVIGSEAMNVKVVEASTGKLAKTVDALGDEAIVNLNGLHSGIYLLQSGKSETVKVQVK